MRLEALDRRQNERHVRLLALAKGSRHTDDDHVGLARRRESARRGEASVLDQRSQCFRRYVDEVRLASVQKADSLEIQVDSFHYETRLCELNGQAQSDVTQSDHARARGAALDLFPEAV